MITGQRTEDLQQLFQPFVGAHIAKEEIDKMLLCQSIFLARIMARECIGVDIHKVAVGNDHNAFAAVKVLLHQSPGIVAMGDDSGGELGDRQPHQPVQIGRGTLVGKEIVDSPDDLVAQFPGQSQIVDQCGRAHNPASQIRRIVHIVRPVQVQHIHPPAIGAHPVTVELFGVARHQFHTRTGKSAAKQSPVRVCLGERKSCCFPEKYSAHRGTRGTKQASPDFRS